MKDGLKYIKNLIFKFLLCEPTKKEKEEIDAWINNSPGNKNIFDRITDKNNIDDKFKIINNIDIEDSIRQNKLMRNKAKEKRIKRLYYLSGSVAAIGIVLFSLWNINNPADSNTAPNERLIDHGGNKAKLILADGKEINLNDTTDIAIQENDANVTIKDQKIEYIPSKKTSKSFINTIKTPHGGEYSLKLSDGTKVWLNSKSELKFPTTFSGNKRVVELKGEAYFEVEKNKKKPFIVRLNNYNVKVLGTKFNINNYPDSEYSKTTLCSGKVKIMPINESIEPIILTPGKQMSMCKSSQKTEVKDVDTSIYTAWIEGYYYFIDTNLSEIMQSLQRWYDIEIFFENNEVKTRRFSGKFSRYDNFNTIIKIIEEGSGLIVRIKGKNVYIR